MTQSILFACNMNSVRSPMAAALLQLNGVGDFKVNSAGVYEGGLDPFVELVMGEFGIAMDAHEPKTLNDVDLTLVDLIIALTPEAAIEARKLMPREAIEFWDVENPSEERGGRDAILESYRRVRDDIAKRLKARFPDLHEKP